LAVDGDLMVDGHRAVVGRVKRDDLTPGSGGSHGGLEMSAGRSDVGAVIAVAACRRDEGAVHLSLRWDNWQHDGERCGETDARKFR
jgi:hypothetical protein